MPTPPFRPRATRRDAAAGFPLARRRCPAPRIHAARGRPGEAGACREGGLRGQLRVPAKLKPETGIRLDGDVRHSEVGAQVPHLSNDASPGSRSVSPGRALRVLRPAALHAVAAEMGATGRSPRIVARAWRKRADLRDSPHWRVDAPQPRRAGAHANVRGIGRPGRFRRGTRQRDHRRRWRSAFLTELTQARACSWEPTPRRRSPTPPPVPSSRSPVPASSWSAPTRSRPRRERSPSGVRSSRWSIPVSSRARPTPRLRA